MGGGMALAAVLMYYKPDTRCARAQHITLLTLFPPLADRWLFVAFRKRKTKRSVTTWARKEAEAKMAAAGETVSSCLSPLSSFSSLGGTDPVLPVDSLHTSSHKLVVSRMD